MKKMKIGQLQLFLWFKSCHEDDGIHFNNDDNDDNTRGRGWQCGELWEEVLLAKKEEEYS